MKVAITLAVCGCYLLALGLVSDALAPGFSFDKLDQQALAKERLGLQSVERPKQCQMLWKQISELALEKPQQQPDYQTAFDGLYNLKINLIARDSKDYEHEIWNVEECLHSLDLAIEEEELKGGDPEVTIRRRIAQFEVELEQHEKDMKVVSDELSPLKSELVEIEEALEKERREKEAAEWAEREKEEAERFERYEREENEQKMREQ